MFIDFTKVSIYLRPGTTDMRKSINGLSLIVQEIMQNESVNGNLYLFLNRKRDILKALYWDRNGFCLWQKRLEKHRFPWSKSEDSNLELSTQELKQLLEGIDFFNKHEVINFFQIA